MQRSQSSKVSSAVALQVLTRDGFMCVASLIAAERGWSIDRCRDKWGEPALMTDGYKLRSLTLDHVNDGYGRMGKAAAGDPAHLVTLCYHHHLNGWATAHRPELRSYLNRVTNQPET